MNLYGYARYGKKYHKGREKPTFYIMNGKKIEILNTVCGMQLIAWERRDSFPIDMAQDFCMNCFRRDAWEMFAHQFLGENRGLA